MSVYYNENDPKAAQWLRNLIKHGLIAHGHVDDRSITEVAADDIRGYDQVHLFAGIGGWSYAARLAGWDDERPLWTGSCPCQPYSAAGKGRGNEDPRHLWPVMFELIRQCRPVVVAGEQVASAIGFGWLDDLSADLEGENYAVWSQVFGAHSVGAPHIRQRLYWLGHAIGQGLEGWASIARDDGQEQPAAERTGCESGGLADAKGSRQQGQSIRATNRLPQDGIEENSLFGGVAKSDSAGWREGRVASETARHRSAAVAASGAARHGHAGTDHGGWAAADWLRCTDGKWRPVVASHVGVADGLPNDMVRSAERFEHTNQAEEVSDGQANNSSPDSALPSLREGYGAQAIQRDSGESAGLLAPQVLRSSLHVGSNDEGSMQQRQPQQDEGEQDGGRNVRGVRRNRAPTCAPHRRGPFQQHPVELEDVVRQMPSSLALAELHGRWSDAEALRALCESICEAGAVQFSPEQTEAAWRSIGRESQDRIRMDFGHLWVANSFSPLSSDEEARMARLRGYGNAIVPQCAAEFLATYIDATGEHQ